MTKQLKTIEILNPSKSATCSMWRYPESAKIFQYRGMDFDGFRVVRVKRHSQPFKNCILHLNNAPFFSHSKTKSRMHTDVMRGVPLKKFVKCWYYDVDHL